MTSNPLIEMSAFNINTNGVARLLENIDPHKAKGPGSIPLVPAKEVAEERAPSLRIIFGASIGHCQSSRKVTAQPC